MSVGEVRTTEQKRDEIRESLDPLGKRDDRNADVTNGEVWWLLGELDAQAARVRELEAENAKLRQLHEEGWG